MAVCMLTSDHPPQQHATHQPRSGYMDGSNPAHAVVLDDCNFHEAANLELFEMERSIQLPVPPDGTHAAQQPATAALHCIVHTSAP
jgi:hypothetical protein